MVEAGSKEVLANRTVVRVRIVTCVGSIFMFAQGAGRFGRIFARFARAVILPVSITTTMCALALFIGRPDGTLLGTVT